MLQRPCDLLSRTTGHRSQQESLILISALVCLLSAWSVQHGLHKMMEWLPQGSECLPCLACPAALQRALRPVRSGSCAGGRTHLKTNGTVRADILNIVLCVDRALVATMPRSPFSFSCCLRMASLLPVACERACQQNDTVNRLAQHLGASHWIGETRCRAACRAVLKWYPWHALRQHCIESCDS